MYSDLNPVKYVFELVQILKIKHNVLNVNLSDYSFHHLSISQHIYAAILAYDHFISWAPLFDERTLALHLRLHV